MSDTELTVSHPLWIGDFRGRRSNRLHRHVEARLLKGHLSWPGIQVVDRVGESRPGVWRAPDIGGSAGNGNNPVALLNPGCQFGPPLVGISVVVRRFQARARLRNSGRGVVV